MGTRLLWAGVLVWSAAGCITASNESDEIDEGAGFRAGMVVICGGLADAPPAMPAPERAAAASRWIGDHLADAEAAALWKSLAPLAPAEKARVVQAAASRAGLATCPVTDVWTASATHAGESARPSG